MKILSAYDEVFNILESTPEARNNDLYLLYFLLKKSGIDPDTVTVTQMLKLMKNGKIYNYKSIVRCRQLIQSKNINLRGKNYFNRKSKELIVKQDLLNSIY